MRGGNVPISRHPLVHVSNVHRHGGGLRRWCANNITIILQQQWKRAVRLRLYFFYSRQKLGIKIKELRLIYIYYFIRLVHEIIIWRAVDVSGVYYYSSRGHALRSVATVAGERVCRRRRRRRSIVAVCTVNAPPSHPPREARLSTAAEWASSRAYHIIIIYTSPVLGRSSFCGNETWNRFI